MGKVSFATKVYRNLLRILPTKPALYLIYFRGYKKILNLKNPQTWGERIQWLKLYGGLEELYRYVDKYEVRKYIEEKIGSSYLTKIYGVYDRVEDIDYDKLPNKFVLKSTNGSGTVLICDDKSKFDKKNAAKIMKKWLKDDYSKEKKEPQYKGVINRIIAEEYLKDSKGSLNDYKFYCYDGKVEYFGVFYDRFVDKSIDFYDGDVNKLEGVQTCYIKNSNHVEKNDDAMKEMIRISEILSSDFTFVRVDLYNIDGKIYFGELTFTDGAGSDPYNPLDFDIKMGRKIPLGKVLK